MFHVSEGVQGIFFSLYLRTGAGIGAGAVDYNSELDSVYKLGSTNDLYLIYTPQNCFPCQALKYYLTRVVSSL